jgi:hypothetical protein
MLTNNYLLLGMFFFGLLWLGVVAFWPARNRAGITAKCLRVHLVPRHPYAELIGDVYRMMAKDYGIDCDLLLEIHVVNTGDAPLTIQKFVAEVESGGMWCPYGPNEELTDYQIRFPDKLVDAVGGGQTPRVDDLAPNLAKETRGVPLVRGIGHQGWLRFDGKLSQGDFATQGQKFNARVQIVDALDKRHVVDMGQRLTDAEIIHNPNVWSKRLSSS